MKKIFLPKIFIIVIAGIFLYLPLTASAAIIRTVVKDNAIYTLTSRGMAYPQHVGCKTIVCYGKSDDQFPTDGAEIIKNNNAISLAAINSTSDCPETNLANDPLLNHAAQDAEELASPMSRAALAELYSAARRDKLKLGDCLKTQNFPDVKKTNIRHNHVLNLKDKNIVHGYPDGNYRPDQTANYAEVLKVTALSFGKADKAKVDALEQKGTPWYVSYKTSLENAHLIPQSLKNLPFETPMSKEQVYQLLDAARSSPGGY